MSYVCIEVSPQRSDWIYGKTIWEAIDNWIQRRTEEYLEVTNFKRMMAVGLITNKKVFIHSQREKAILDILDVRDNHGLTILSRNAVLKKYFKEFKHEDTRKKIRDELGIYCDDEYLDE